MKKHFLFDLDGTVLKMNADDFAKDYFKELAIYFADLIDPRKLAKFIMEATDKMCKDSSDLDNYSKFFKYFEELSGENLSVFEKRFDTFYEEKFDKLQGSCTGNKEIIESISVLKEKGYRVVLATNPVFPMKANEHRLSWAGLKNQ